MENDHRLSVLAGREDALLLGNMAKAHGSDINGALFIDSDGLVTCSSDKTVKLWRNVHEIGDQKVASFTLIDQRQYAIYAMDVSLQKNLLIVTSIDGIAKVKFIYSEKATKFCEISTLLLYYVCSASQE